MEEVVEHGGPPGFSHPTGHELSFKGVCAESSERNARHAKYPNNKLKGAVRHGSGNFIGTCRNKLCLVNRRKE